MEGKTLQDFLQVNINMEKFNLFTTSITNFLASHDRQLQHHSKELAQMRISMEERITRMQGELDYQKDKFDKKRKEDSLFFHSFITETTHKYDAYLTQTDKRFTLLQDKVGHNHTQEELIDLIKSDVQTQVNEQVKVLEQQMSLFQAQVRQLEADVKKSVSSQDFLLKNVIEAYDNKKKKGEVELVEPKNQKRQMLPTSSKNHHRNQKHYVEPAPSSPDKTMNLDQATFKQAQQRRRKKAQQKCQQQNLQYATISAKVDALETRLKAKQNEDLNKVVYPTKTGNNLLSEPSQQVFPLSMDRIQFERKGLEMNITDKLEHIEDILHQKFVNCDQENQKLRLKIQSLSKQLERTIRKFQKQKFRGVDYSLQMRKMEERRADDKVLDGLVVMVKRQGQQFEEGLEGKMQKKIWERQFPKFNEKFQFITQSLQEKADRQEIKRAFEFVQDKIKEIVLLLASEAQNEKQGAGRRLPFKCLSCDKQLDNSTQSTQRNMQLKVPSRCNTSNLRKRIRGGGPNQSR